MNILSLIGSKRKNGNTHLLVEQVLSHLDQTRYHTETIFLNDYNFIGCTGCGGCDQSTTCMIKDDMQLIYQKMAMADVLILASPTYYYNVSADMKKLIDRFFCLNMFDPNDRSNWTSYNHIHGLKASVTITICEQQHYKDVGFTTEAMAKPLEDIGYPVLYKLEGLRSYQKGEILNQPDALSDAFDCAKAIDQYCQAK